MKKEIKKQLTKKNKNSVNYGWIIKIIIITFIISVLIGVVFDMVGVAVTAADEQVFHSMAAKRVRGAKLAVKFKKNADKLSSFCQDVIGDICGIVSGSTGAVISLKITNELNVNGLFVTLIVMGIISSLTIGGKAMEKAIAMNKSNKILYRFSFIMSYFIRG